MYLESCHAIFVLLAITHSVGAGNSEAGDRLFDLRLVFIQASPKRVIGNLLGKKEHKSQLQWGFEYQTFN